MPAKIYGSAATALLAHPLRARERAGAVGGDHAEPRELLRPSSGRRARSRQRSSPSLACKQVSSTCAETPASTDGMDQMFAIMCCEEPKSGCAAAVGADRDSALKEVKKLFSDGGFSQCTLKSYFKAGTGEKG